MVSVKIENGKFLAKGNFDMGMAGVFENKEFGQGNIEIEYEVEDFIKDLDSDYSWMNGIKDIFKTVQKDEEALAKAMEDYLNNKEAWVQKNIKHFNDYFLYQLILNFVDCGYPFWETEDAILPEFAEKEEFEYVYEDGEISSAIYALDEEFREKPIDGVAQKTDVEALARKLFPMFNFDGLIASITPDILNFNGSWMQVQFSDGWDNEFYCSAYEEFDENMIPRDWHNF